MKISVEDLAIVITMSGPYYRWIGNYGYDTRPYAEWRPDPNGCIHGQKAPVAYEVGYASNGREPYQAPQAGGIDEWLNDLPVGAKLIIPDPDGVNSVGEHQYIREADGWVSLGFYCYDCNEYGQWDYRPVDGGLQVVEWEDA